MDGRGFTDRMNIGPGTTNNLEYDPAVGMRLEPFAPPTPLAEQTREERPGQENGEGGRKKC
jgi:hypothetical protein